MQRLDPRGVYADADVIDALTGYRGTRTMRFRYDRLNSSNTLIETLDFVEGCTVANNSLAEIKRTARFAIRDLTSIDFLRDRIQPWAILQMPDGGTVEWPQGVFILATPSRSLPIAGSVSREVEAYDQLVVLRDDKVEQRYTVATGVAFTTAITTLVATVAGLGTTNIVPSALTVPAAREWEPGTSKLTILNDLLSSINYGSAWFDELGRLQCKPYQSPADRAVEYLYSDMQVQSRTGDATQTIDLFEVPNKFIVVKSEPDQPALTSTVTNANPASPSSTISRGRTITAFITEEEAANQTTLDAKAARYAFEASQVYETIEFSTILMPFHSDSDVITIEIPGLAVDTKYGETSWELPMAAGESMRHSARRVVGV